MQTALAVREWFIKLIDVLNYVVSTSSAPVVSVWPNMAPEPAMIGWMLGLCAAGCAFNPEDGPDASARPMALGDDRRIVRPL